LKREESTVSSSLRAVSLVILLVSVVAFSTIVYSAYVDYNGVVGAVGTSQATPAVSVKTVVEGTTTSVYLNITLPNDGLYDIRIGLSCLTNTSSDVTCSDASVVIPPGEEQTLRFTMTAENQQGVLPSGVKGNLSLSLVPFASLNLVVNLSSLAGENA
jgi:hypothetical protein